MKSGSVGRPIPGVSLKIVDNYDQPVGVGEVGEIIVQGENIMKGYYNDPDGTSEALKDGWLYTGDLGKMDKDGFIFLTARKKGIMKIGGHRISPKEIEEVIVSIPEVIDCMVTAIEDPLLGEAIKAQVVVNEGCDQDDLRNKISGLCKQTLSGIKLPRVIEFTFMFDVTSTGKKVMRSSHLVSGTKTP